MLVPTRYDTGKEPKFPVRVQHGYRAVFQKSGNFQKWSVNLWDRDVAVQRRVITVVIIDPPAVVVVIFIVAPTTRFF